MKVRFTDEAQARLHEIHAHLMEVAEPYAAVVIDRLTRRAQQIGEMPRAGRRVPEYALDDLREALMPPYRLLYRIRPHEIQIISIMHSRQQLPQSPDAFGA